LLQATLVWERSSAINRFTALHGELRDKSDCRYRKEKKQLLSMFGNLV
jgi:hypothetical protein